MNEVSKIHPHTGKNSISYVINTPLSVELSSNVVKIQNILSEKFGQKIWCVPEESLHLTLMDWLAPFTEYLENPDVIYQRVEVEYINALCEVLANQHQIKIHFDTVKVSPSTIFIQASLDKTLNKIRESFLQKVELLPGTKPPSNITHISIARFSEEFNLDVINDTLSDIIIDCPMTIDKWRLVRESKLPMLEYEVIEVFYS